MLLKGRRYNHLFSLWWVLSRKAANSRTPWKVIEPFSLWNDFHPNVVLYFLYFTRALLGIFATHLSLPRSFLWTDWNIHTKEAVSGQRFYGGPCRIQFLLEVLWIFTDRAYCSTFILLDSLKLKEITRNGGKHAKSLSPLSCQTLSLVLLHLLVCLLREEKGVFFSSLQWDVVETAMFLWRLTVQSEGLNSNEIK